jgi:hypothetical protein
MPRAAAIKQRIKLSQRSPRPEPAASRAALAYSGALSPSEGFQMPDSESEQLSEVQGGRSQRRRRLFDEDP